MYFFGVESDYFPEHVEIYRQEYAKYPFRLHHWLCSFIWRGQHFQSQQMEKTE